MYCLLGNNQIRKITIENYKFIIQMAEEIGVKTDFYFKSGIINHYIPFERIEKIDKDYVIVLKI